MGNLVGSVEKMVARAHRVSGETGESGGEGENGGKGERETVSDRG